MAGLPVTGSVHSGRLAMVGAALLAAGVVLLAGSRLRQQTAERGA
jgi:hypothetical protein